MEEKKMIFNVIGILIGLAILIAGVYYFIKEKADRESRKIYSVVSVLVRCFGWYGYKSICTIIICAKNYLVRYS